MMCLATVIAQEDEEETNLPMPKCHFTPIRKRLLKLAIAIFGESCKPNSFVYNEIKLTGISKNIPLLFFIAQELFNNMYL